MRVLMYDYAGGCGLCSTIEVWVTLYLNYTLYQGCYFVLPVFMLLTPSCRGPQLARKVCVLVELEDLSALMGICGLGEVPLQL